MTAPGLRRDIRETDIVMYRRSYRCSPISTNSEASQSPSTTLNCFQIPPKYSQKVNMAPKTSTPDSFVCRKHSAGCRRWCHACFHRLYRCQATQSVPVCVQDSDILLGGQQVSNRIRHHRNRCRYPAISAPTSGAGARPGSETPIGRLVKCGETQCTADVPLSTTNHSLNCRLPTMRTAVAKPKSTDESA
jgi:hypothetical protein